MARQRAKLSEKQERILVQAQLMGSTAYDMQQIGNRLMALKKEAEEISNIADTTQNFSWDSSKAPDQFSVTTPDGHLVEAVRGKRGNSRWDHFTWTFDIRVTKPGTRFKTRVFKGRELRCEYNWKKRLMPGQSKELYALIRWVKNSLPWEQPDV